MVDAISYDPGLSGGTSWDSMGSTGTVQTQVMDRETFGAQVVTQTLNTMNQGPANTGNADYDFQKSVLTAAYTLPGSLVDYEA